LHDWLHFRNAKARLESIGLGVLLREMVEGTLPVAEAVPAFLKRFYREWLDAVSHADPALGQFHLENHEAAIQRFQALDEQAIDRSYERVRARLLADAAWRSGAWDAPASSERGLLLREVNKRRRHLPLRQLFKQIPSLLLKLKPCLMMSPLAVSTFLDSESLSFDLVVFDEASQVRPHDAICAIYRGKQLVVAGDQQQLPPTNFFERTGGAIDSDDESDEEDEDAQGSTKDFESILDLCVTLRIPRQRLRWHYRSRRESLIAFSNHHFYDDELVTFPDSGVRFEYVPDGRWQGGSSGVNPVEARHAAALVIEHAKDHPELSLGVITMNQAQQLLVLEEVERLKRTTPSVGDFFSEGRDEPFFVKNLENVQGDERDAMILTVNYAKGSTGALAHRFGPLSIAGGERRLNVAVTRARRQLILVSSIRADDIDIGRTSHRGPRLLRYYLDYAERGPEALAAEIRDGGDRDFDSDFEREVAQALTREGLTVRRQVGCGSFRIDLALVDPQRPGRYVLGVECDGATYHSSATARDRDRLRQSVLEGLGWRICRIWSTDWVRNPRRQIERVLAAYEAAKDVIPDEGPAPRRPHRTRPVVTDNGVNGHRAPSALPKSQAAQFHYASIEQVPSATIDELLVCLLKENGATAQSDLFRATAKRLGFERTGRRISQRLMHRVNLLKRQGAIALDGEDRLISKEG
jgi:very-short-patch-repair endonuclease